MRWLRFLFPGELGERQIDAELQFHIEEQIEANIEAGMTPEEAGRQARLSLGSREQLKEECRDVYSFRSADALQDCRHSFRALRKNPAFALISILVLGLGIGANTTVFSIVETVLLRPLPFHDPQNIERVRRRIDTGSSYSFDMYDYTRLRARQDVFSALAILDIGAGGYNLEAGGVAEQISGIKASAEFFSVMGVTPVLGRVFVDGDDVPGSPHVATISQGLWGRRFGNDPSIIGRKLIISGVAYTVAGVVPDSLRDFTPADVYLCLPVPKESLDRTNGFGVLGRLKPGLTRRQAEARLDVTARQLARNSVLTNMPNGLVLHSLQEDQTGRIRPGLEILFGAVVLVLLIACSNAANLALARGVARQRELSIMFALGAGRMRIVRRLLTESILLATGGGLLGLFIAYWGVRVLPAISTYQLPQTEGLRVDVWALVFVVAASLLSAILAALAPAFQLSRVNLTDALKQGTVQGGSGHGKNRLRSGLVLSQIAVSTVLLAGAVLLVRSFWKLATVDPGFKSDHVLTMKISVAEARYPRSARVDDYDRRVIEQIERAPGIVAASPTTIFPGEDDFDFPVRAVGGPARASRKPSDDGEVDAQYRSINAQFFKVLRIPVLKGRPLADSDTASSEPVVVINQALARQAFPNEQALGRALVIGEGYLRNARDLRPRTIVGIVGDTKEDGLRSPPPPTIYVPGAQAPEMITRIALEKIPTRWLIRTAGDPMRAAPTIRRAVLAVDATQPATDFETLEETLSQYIAASRFNMLMLSIFAMLALVLAVIGVYGLMSYSVSQRTREMGVRIALGARPGDLIRGLVWQAAKLGLAGIAAGLAGSALLNRFLRSLLYGVQPSDAITFVSVACLLILVLLLANFVPAMRAASIQPLIALREE